VSASSFPWIPMWVLTQQSWIFQFIFPTSQFPSYFFN
jgi:hypothetical protein